MSVIIQILNNKLPLAIFAVDNHEKSENGCFWMQNAYMIVRLLLEPDRGVFGYRVAVTRLKCFDHLHFGSYYTDNPDPVTFHS